VWVKLMATVTQITTRTAEVCNTSNLEAILSAKNRKLVTIHTGSLKSDNMP